MNTLASSSRLDNHGTGPMSWLRRAESWLDSKGKFAWIAAMVLGFVFFWPVGLALLGYMIWSGKMSCSKHTSSRRHDITLSRGTGNSAFDAYRDETLQRLEQEQGAFEAFLDRLRQAKDKTEFDQFMDERARAASEAASEPAERTREA